MTVFGDKHIMVIKYHVLFLESWWIRKETHVIRCDIMSGPQCHHVLYICEAHPKKCDQGSHFFSGYVSFGFIHLLIGHIIFYVIAPVSLKQPYGIYVNQPHKSTKDWSYKHTISTYGDILLLSCWENMRWSITCSNNWIFPVAKCVYIVLTCFWR